MKHQIQIIGTGVVVRIGQSIGIDKVRVKEAWVEIAGIGVIRYTEQVRLQGDRLFITLNNAALKADLSLRKTELVQLINEHLKKEVVKEVIFL